MKKLLPLLIVLLFCSPCYGTNWYLDKDATGSNNGTSWTNAWQSFTSVVWGGAGLIAGDTLYISGGSSSKTYTATANNMFTIGGSGASGSVITIATGAKSPSPSGHDGKVIFDGDNTYGDLIKANSKYYIIFDGEKSETINWVLQNTKKTVRWDPTIADLPYAKGLIFRYMEFTGGANGLGLNSSNPNCTYSDRVEIEHCYFHDIRDDFCIKVLAACLNNLTYDGILIHHNVIYPNLYSLSDGAGPDGIQTSYGTTVYNNTFEGKVGPLVYTPPAGQHSDHIQPSGKYFKIYNNQFLNPGNACIEYESNEIATGNVRIWNNVFASIDPTQAGYNRAIEIQWWALTESLSDFYIYNNTFVDLNGFFCIHATPDHSLTVTDASIVNNIFYNSANSSYALIYIDIGSSNCGTSFTIDHNLINAGATGSTDVICLGSEYSGTNTITTAPTFVSYSPKTATNDFRAASGMAAQIDAGISLSDYFTYDILEVFRPQGVNWDIGAYEYPRGSFRGINSGGVTFR